MKAKGIEVKNSRRTFFGRIGFRIASCACAVALAAGGVPCVAFAAGETAAQAAAPTATYRLVAQAGDDGAVENVRALIAALPSVTEVVEADGDQIARARAAYDALDAADRALLDTETNRAVLGTTQSYGRVLELAEAGWAVLHPVDDATALPDGIYESSVTSVWDRGKSASKQDREWSAVRVRVEGGKALVTLRINSATYSYLRASGQTVRRLASSGAGESLFVFPVSLGLQMVFTAYSQTMAAEIAYNLTVSVSVGAHPDRALADEEQEGNDGGEGSAEVADKPLVHTDEVTGDVVVERGTFALGSDVAGYMFRLAAPIVIASDGAHMTVSGQMNSEAYSHLFIGTVEQAAEKTLEEGVADGSFIPAVPVVNEDGKTVGSFTFPLASLDKDVSLCLYSVKNQHWVSQADHGAHIRFASADLEWYATDEDDERLAHVFDLLENLPARNTIVPDDAAHEAVVRAARDAYEELNRLQKAQVPARLVMLLEWDESMFDLGFNTDFLPMGIAGKAYDGAVYLSGKNGSAGKSIAVTAGTLPDGLTLQMDDKGRWAQFEGVPERNGSWTFKVELSNDLGERVSKDFTIHVGYAPVIRTAKLADARVGQAYDQVLSADAYPDATWSLVQGALPEGLTLYDDGDAASTARICGTPAKAGAFTFTLACDNFANGTETRTYTLRVGAADSPSADVALLEDALARLSAVEGKVASLQKENTALSATVAALQTRLAKAESKLPKAVSINAKTVTAKTVQKALKKARNPYAATVTLGAKVRVIKKAAFKGTSVTKLVVKTTHLTKKGTKGSLKSSKVSTIQVKVAAKKLAKTKKACKLYFTKANAGRKVAVK